MERPFSLRLYLLIVILLSWPFQIAYVFLGENYRPILLISMLMVAVATFISGKWIFKDGFKNAGWSWGKPRHYIYVIVLALFLWLFPSLIERWVGWYSGRETTTSMIAITFFFSFLITLVPAFSEEFGWRGYLLPRLLRRHSYKKALLLHGIITWIWHLPFVFVMGFEADDNPWVSVPLVVLVSFIPTILHAVVFAYIWSRTASLAVATMYHVSFDEVRDTLENTVGFGFLGQNWQILVLSILGIFLVSQVKWKLSNI